MNEEKPTPPQNVLSGPILDFYTPDQAALALGIRTYTLARLRREGKVVGTRAGTTTIYTREQLLNADLSREKPGPKAGEGSRMGRAKYSWPNKEGDSTDTSFPNR